MLKTEELSIPEYERSLQRTKKADVISIALYHIKRVRELEALLGNKDSPATPSNTTLDAICPTCESKDIFRTGKEAVECNRCHWVW